MNRFIHILLIGIGFVIPTGAFAQLLTAEKHSPLVTDSLLAYKLSYIPVTDSGRNCLWDFSELAIDSAELIEVDYYAPDTTSIGLHREHFHQYFTIHHDTLWQNGYENSLTRMRYTSPIPLLRYPFSFGDSLSGTFAGNGRYCHMQPIHTEGNSLVHADAVGRLILPDLVLDTALRVHQQRQYRETSHHSTSVCEDRYIWYSPHYRYPLLESVHIQTIHNQDTVILASAYLYQQEQEDIPAYNPRREDESELLAADSLVTNVSYSPNPVYRDVQIKYELAQPAMVYISLHYNGGATTYQTLLHQEEAGEHILPVNMSGMPIGTYVVYIHANDIVVSGNLIKL